MAILDPSRPLTDIAAAHNTTIHALALWLSRPADNDPALRLPRCWYHHDWHDAWWRIMAARAPTTSY